MHIADHADNSQPRQTHLRHPPRQALANGVQIGPELARQAFIDDDDPLSDEEKALLEARLAAYEKDPDAGSSWEEVESRVRARLKSPANQ